SERREAVLRYVGSRRSTTAEYDDENRGSQKQAKRCGATCHWRLRLEFVRFRKKRLPTQKGDGSAQYTSLRVPRSTISQWRVGLGRRVTNRKSALRLKPIKSHPPRSPRRTNSLFRRDLRFASDKMPPLMGRSSALSRRGARCRADRFDRVESLENRQ